MSLYSSMEGGELFERIKKRKIHPYTERDAARYISMIVKAVAHLHDMDIVSSLLSHLCCSILLSF